ncbi:unnamed protein product [Prorocentrum cordatum]|uniref:C3H1-type domain-containing protein n=1 Tax=Prorocentrum cordatum TaxID=2364126 RepID=A0ABN9VVC1_9DINO|nr:unnamed protein product [Polarella glacialis]
MTPAAGSCAAPRLPPWQVPPPPPPPAAPPRDPSPKDSWRPRLRLRASTATTCAPSDGGLSPCGRGSDGEPAEAAGPPGGGGCALPLVVSSLAWHLRVRNTFWELPVEPEGGSPRCRRRPRSAPPPGRPAEGAERGPEEPGSSEHVGDEGLPSLGSRRHATGACQPCAFLYTKGCASGVLCQFCHLCDEQVLSARRRARFGEKRAAWKEFRKQDRRLAAAERRQRRPLAGGRRGDGAAQLGGP